MTEASMKYKQTHVNKSGSVHGSKKHSPASCTGDKDTPSWHPISSIYADEKDGCKHSSKYTHTLITKQHKCISATVINISSMRTSKDEKTHGVSVRIEIIENPTTIIKKIV